jgi:hypothetical protein
MYRGVFKLALFLLNHVARVEYKGSAIVPSISNINQHGEGLNAHESVILGKCLFIICINGQC